MAEKTRRGYAGEVVLVSPTGEVRRLQVSGRYRVSRFNRELNRLVMTKELGLHHRGGKDKAQKLDREFRRLLSAGWRVVANPGSEAEAEGIRDEWKKGTDEVNGSTQTGDRTHGGDHNSGEVLHQSKRPRGNRGGRKFDPQRRQRQQERSPRPVKAQATGVGSNPVYSLQPLRVSPGLLESAEESAELLARLVGRSALKVQRGVTVDAERLLVALEVGDDPLPALEAPDERPRLKVLVTPDCSGSTQNWSGLGRAWALHLSKLPETDVVYIVNFNGHFEEVDEEALGKLLESVDVVLYLGDGDGYELCEAYATRGATVVALDTYCASWEEPRLKESERIGKGHLYWVDRVSAKAPETWTEAIKLCLG